MKNMTIINLTPHPLVFTDGRTIESSGIARCAQTEVEVGKFDGLPIVVTSFGDVVGLPEPSDGVAYVVSSITAQACVGRLDVFVPARPIRDEQGRIVGCAALGRISPPETPESAAIGYLDSRYAGNLATSISMGDGCAADGLIQETLRIARRGERS